MFSPAANKSRLGRLKDTTTKGAGFTNDSSPTPTTPVASMFLQSSSSITSLDMPPRPSTGTPVPWASRLTSASRTQFLKEKEKASGSNLSGPVLLCEFPKKIRNAQVEWLKTHGAGFTEKSEISGGMDRNTGLCWIIFSDSIYVWSYLTGNSSKHCVVLKVPSDIDIHCCSKISGQHKHNWLVAMIQWENPIHNKAVVVMKDHNSAGVIICCQKCLTVVFWTDIFSESQHSPVVSIMSDNQFHSTCMETNGTDISISKSFDGIGSVKFHVATSIIVCAIPGSSLYGCIALVCTPYGEVWHFECKRNSISRYCVLCQLDPAFPAMSIAWCFPDPLFKGNKRGFFILTNQGIQCWSIELKHGGEVRKAWYHPIVGVEEDSEITKEGGCQKQVWPLDMQIDAKKQAISVIIAYLRKDRMSNLIHKECSLITLYYKHSFLNTGSIESTTESVLERRFPPKIIISSTEEEEGDLLFSMRLRTGGKPEGSIMLLSGDGRAAIVNLNNAIQYYPFDLPWDAGKVLDASSVNSMDDDSSEWVVLTEKAGIWGIPERVVSVGSIERLDLNLSQKGSLTKSIMGTIGLKVLPGDSSSLYEADSDVVFEKDIELDSTQGISNKLVASDDEPEVLIGSIFQEFLHSGQTTNVLDILVKAGAFEREGEMNAFTKTSKSIVDTLAKQWASSRVTSITVLAAISSQLLEKQRRHQKFLQFLAASNCHEELWKRQREALLAIMGHGEKLAAMIQLRDQQNAFMNARIQYQFNISSEEAEMNMINSALWKLIQLAGENARRSNVMLMDRDTAEVFYSRVSDLEHFFFCVDRYLNHVIGESLSLRLRVERLREIANACVTIIQAAIKYRDIQYAWYPPIEGLVSWYCQPTVRLGVWKAASLILELKAEADTAEPSMKSDIFHLLCSVTDVLLDLYFGAISTKVDREEEYRGTQLEYWKRRDTLLNALYLLIKEIADESQITDGLLEGKEGKEKWFSHHGAPLIDLAKRHAGYQTLWNICSEFNNMQYLKHLMHESMGFKEGRFSNFVFEQCYKNHDFSTLLRLGEEFPEELRLFLQNHKNLLWLHEIFLGNFTCASETLHMLSLSQKDSQDALEEEEGEEDASTTEFSLVERKHLLHLSKISALAGRSPGYEEKVKRLNADLHILAVQEDLRKHGWSDGTVVSPRQLVEICLRCEIRDLVLHSFDVFAWAGSAFRRNNKSLLEKSWMHVVDLDDWVKMHEASEEEGWSDEQKLQILCSTALFYASKRCYGQSSVCYEGSFQDLLPLLQEDEEVGNAYPGKWSVERVIMQHQEFSEAGELMLMALRLGKHEGDQFEREDSGLMVNV